MFEKRTGNLNKESMHVKSCKLSKMFIVEALAVTDPRQFSTEHAQKRLWLISVPKFTRLTTIGY